jgi:hypothetical protein
MNTSDAISLALAQEIASRLRKDASLLTHARKTLHRWKTRNADSPGLMRCYLEWEELLKLPREAIADLLVSQTDNAQRLRTNAPFAGVLSPREVWAIKRAIFDERTRAGDKPS